ncbi:FAD-dependent oxidoreductase [Irregularibacter muris]|uniref:FAD-dependent oxidoreductase n=1 Tax=Irregularibacter muris TaxID=1796619 RepID=A0AAE3HED9_9FIRM|nr:FAD-dependent oxidoreductase [Irregularibacter muris]MCR1897568.1 FAD-dependent oxidoreductase [Irregularibacter muris]
MLNYDVIVIGGGPAGLAAAIEARKSGVKKIVVLERDRELGGILQQCIHNGFGLHQFKEELTGPQYAQRFIDELEDLNIEYHLNTMVLEITSNKEVHAISKNQGYQIYKAKSIVLAMGCRERTRGAISIPGKRPAGVMTAGTAQRYINMEGYMVGKKVVILGSGDIGLIMARRMTLEGADVQAVVEILPYSGGLTRNIVQCLQDFDIPLLLAHTIIDIEGKDRVKGVTIAKVDEERQPIKGSEQYFDCDTLLLSVGLIPENELTEEAGIGLDPTTRGPVVNNSMETSTKGIFACGNVLHVHDLVDFVTEESQRAGRNAAAYIMDKLQPKGKNIETIAGNGIGYIIPQKIQINDEDKIKLLMRPNNVFKNIKMVVKVEDKVVKTFKKKHLAPGEMESLIIEKDLLKEEGIQSLKVEVLKEDE